MKLSVYSYSTPELTPEQLAATLKELGYEGVEWTVGYPQADWDPVSQWHVSEEKLEEDVPFFSELAEKYDLETVCLGSGIVCNEDNQFDRFRRFCKAAQRLQCPQIRLNPPILEKNAPYLPLHKETVKNLKTFEQICKDTNIKIVLEIHFGTIMPSALAALKIVEEFNPKYIGVIFDAGNMIVEGHEAWQMGIESLGPYLSHVHIKNIGWFYEDGKWRYKVVGLKEGIADYEEIISYLSKANYTGYLSVEDDRGREKRNSKQIIREDLFTLREWLLKIEGQRI